MNIVWSKKSLPPSLLWVWVEVSTELWMWWEITPTHLITDTATHILLNTFEFDSPKVSQWVNRSRETIVHLLWKYWSHHLVEKLSHDAHHHKKHLHVFWHHIHEHVHYHDVSMVTFPILMCLLAEQIYKFYSSNERSWKSLS
jgi:hypothetical protein